jgi:8-oxo-dGTP diphosphatase
MIQEITNFNIRVYSIILSEDNRKVLLSDEFQLGMQMTKFPGGGLKPGEGTIECLRRETDEELKQEIEIIEHFYTTDFFQQALFYKDHQLISIYYLARLKQKPAFKISEKQYDFEGKNGDQSFRWVHLKRLSVNDVTLPIDKKVVSLLKQKFEG